MGTRPCKSYRNRVSVQDYGGARRDRTADLLHAMQALSQLSYSPMEAGTLRTRTNAVKGDTDTVGRAIGHVTFYQIGNISSDRFIPRILFDSIQTYVTCEICC